MTLKWSSKAPRINVSDACPTHPLQPLQRLAPALCAGSGQGIPLWSYILAEASQPHPQSFCHCGLCPKTWLQHLVQGQARGTHSGVILLLKDLSLNDSCQQRLCIGVNHPGRGAVARRKVGGADPVCSSLDSEYDIHHLYGSRQLPTPLRCPTADMRLAHCKWCRWVRCGYLSSNGLSAPYPLQELPSHGRGRSRRSVVCGTQSRRTESLATSTWQQQQWRRQQRRRRQCRKQQRWRKQ